MSVIVNKRLFLEGFERATAKANDHFVGNVQPREAHRSVVTVEFHVHQKRDYVDFEGHVLCYFTGIGGLLFP